MDAKNKKNLVQGLNKYFYYLLVIFLAAIIFISVRFFLWPKYVEIRELGVLGYNQERNELALKQSELSRLEELARQLSAVSEAEVDRLRVLLPEEVNNPAIFRQMERLAQDNDLVLTRVSIGGGGGEETQGNGAAAGTASEALTSDVQGVASLNISVSFSGGQGYDHLKSFLASIEKNLMVLDITSFNYSPNQGDYSMNLITYYLAR